MLYKKQRPLCIIYKFNKQAFYFYFVLYKNISLWNVFQLFYTYSELLYHLLRDYMKSTKKRIRIPHDIQIKLFKELTTVLEEYLKYKTYFGCKD